MGRFVTVSTLLMGGVLIFCDWLFPESIVTWFTVTELQFDIVRGLIIAMLAALMLADAFSVVDNVNVRRVAGLVALSLVAGALRFGFEYPVYMLDVLFVLAAGICFALVALQREPEEAPGMKPVRAARVPVHAAVPSVGMFERLREHSPRRRRLFPAAYISDIKDDSHRLTVGIPGRPALSA